MEAASEPQVMVRMTSQWTSGNTVMNVEINFAASDLETALRRIHQASPMVPIFSNPNLEEVLS